MTPNVEDRPRSDFARHTQFPELAFEYAKREKLPIFRDDKGYWCRLDNGYVPLRDPLPLAPPSLEELSRHFSDAMGFPVKAETNPDAVPGTVFLRVEHQGRVTGIALTAQEHAELASDTTSLWASKRTELGAALDELMREAVVPETEPPATDAAPPASDTEAPPEQALGVEEPPQDTTEPAPEGTSTDTTPEQQEPALEPEVMAQSGGGTTPVEPEGTEPDPVTMLDKRDPETIAEDTTEPARRGTNKRGRR